MERFARFVVLHNGLPHLEYQHKPRLEVRIRLAPGEVSIDEAMNGVMLIFRDDPASHSAVGDAIFRWMAAKIVASAVRLKKTK